MDGSESIKQFMDESRNALDQACVAALQRGCGVRVTTQIAFKEGKATQDFVIDPTIPAGEIVYDQTQIKGI